MRNIVYFFFFGFGGGSFSRVYLTISAIFSLSSSHSGFTCAVFFDPGYAFVSISSKRCIVSGVVLRNRVPSQTSPNIRPSLYTQYSPIIGLKVILGTRESVSVRNSRVDLEVDMIFWIIELEEFYNIWKYFDIFYGFFIKEFNFHTFIRGSKN